MILFFAKQVSGDNQAKVEIFIFTRNTKSKADIKRAIQRMTGGRLSMLYSVNQPFIIRTGELKKDQKVFYNFLLNHHTDDRLTEEVIGKILQSQETTTVLP